MLENTEFFGAWITPTGEIHYTNSINSHSKVIDELGIRQMLINAGKTINWTESERKMYFDNDLAYIAMKLGYIRVTSFMDQIGIESGIDIDDFSSDQINSIETVYQKIRQKLYLNGILFVKSVIFEKFQTGQFIEFNSFFDFLDYFKSKQF